jgi:hypothetical protein
MRRAVLAGILFLLFSIPGLGQATTLDVQQCYQEQTQWCWAGSSQAILRYYSVNKTQTEIAQYGAEGQNIWNWLFGSSTNPTRRGIDMILNYFGRLATTQMSRCLTQEESQTFILAGKPFVVRWGWDSGGGHFVVGKGMTGSTMQLMDPWYGPTVNTYDWVVRGSSHTWTHSLPVDTSPPGRISGFLDLLLQ